MAVCLQSNVASDLCIGKPSLRSIPITASVGEALVALREWGEAKLGVALGEKKSKDKAGGIVGDICMVDVLCYLCSQQNIKCPVSALQNPVSVLLSKGDGVVRAIDPDSSILDVLDVILDENVQASMLHYRRLFCLPEAKASRIQLANARGPAPFLPQQHFLFSSIAPSPSPTPPRCADVLSIHHVAPATSPSPSSARPP
ncbi:uncharacterized protein A4U43_C04F34820 [Asparagus officinalis]|uniref:CBS domain-containing protein n=1 Tax=Asparagus officinalis TaxID=4686 RepID=A0A5P1F5T5_ASPOF|nr:uncharacterized protein A4U43_C04F34820 [Asparagus officinalis]